MLGGWLVGVNMTPDKPSASVCSSTESCERVVGLWETIDRMIGESPIVIDLETVPVEFRESDDEWNLDWHEETLKEVYGQGARFVHNPGPQPLREIASRLRFLATAEF